MSPPAGDVKIPLSGFDIAALRFLTYMFGLELFNSRAVQA
jgi:hypothetical protein